MRTSKMCSLLASAGLLAALAACETIEEDINEAIGGEFVANLTPTAGGSGSGRATTRCSTASAPTRAPIASTLQPRQATFRAR